MRALNTKEHRIHAGDRSNARARQIQLNDWMPSALGGLIILGFFIVLSVMVSRRLPDGAETEFSIMLGAFGDDDRSRRELLFWVVCRIERENASSRLERYKC